MSLWRALLGLVFQERCGGCGQWGSSAFCRACEAAWPGLGASVCPRCASPELPCGDCERLNPAYAGTVAVAAYTGVAREGLHALKYHKAKHLAPLFAERVAAAAGFPDGDWLVVPVPMTKEGLKQRGFNQAALLGRAIARRRQLPYAEALRRVKVSAPQHGLPTRDRLTNMVGAFACAPAVSGRRVLLVDDIMTTGATAHEAAQALLAAGAVEVRVAVVARTLPPGMALPG